MEGIVSRQDDGGLASGEADGLDSRDILEVELAEFDHGDKIFVLALETQRWLRSFQPQPYPKKEGPAGLLGG